tara:strand:- start:36 stop:647 length:612 start_codon:yes stop_codon:yes gene_type:complete
MTASLPSNTVSCNQHPESNVAFLRRAENFQGDLQRHIPLSEGQLKVHSAPFRGSFPGVLSEALRAAGLGSRVMVAQLLKGGVSQGPNGVVRLCDRLEWIRPEISSCINSPISDRIDSSEKNSQLKAVKAVWEICKDRLLKGTLNQLVLDEVGLAISLGYLEEIELISTLEQRPLSMDVILTGPSIPPSVTAIADQVTVLRGGL